MPQVEDPNRSSPPKEAKTSEGSAGFSPQEKAWFEKGEKPPTDQAAEDDFFNRGTEMGGGAYTPNELNTTAEKKLQEEEPEEEDLPLAA